MSDEMKKALDRLEAARKKLTLQGKGKSGNATGETEYADAYKALCKLDPIRYRPLRGKRR
jgi:hypothetical protein